ncbi:MAG: hypothetical protein ACRENA_14505, partial [Vulcanimicrobiaceae bacterium]
METKNFRPSKPTVFILLVALGQWAVQVFDWFQRGNVIDAWLIANRDTVLGHGLIVFIDNAWVVLLIALVLWWHDVDLKKRLGH